MIEGLSKTFPGQRALRDVDLAVRSGSVHGLIGQNGSGKSTLIKVLAGFHRPDPGGRASVAGAPLALGDAGAAAAGGLRFVHQDLGLIPDMDTFDNLALGRGYVRGRTGAISWAGERRIARDMLHGLGYDFDLHLPVSRLAASERTGVAIARALQGWEASARVLVLDEPTATLPAAEVRRLYEVIRMVQARGVAIVYVSHHFNEVFDITDEVTVLRDGAVVGTWPTGTLDERQLIEHTIGRRLDERELEGHGSGGPAGRGVLGVEDLRGSVLDGVSFELHAGSVVGVAGVTGSGREELAGLVFGCGARGGRVRLGDRTVPPARPDWSTRHGMGYVPADRATSAALGGMTVRENLTVSCLGRFYGAQGLRRAAEVAATREWIDRLELTPADPEAAFDTLSGGNQQKVILARALSVDPAVLVLDEPTQGVDVGAKDTIHRAIRTSAGRGAAVLVSSTESEELVALCDRVLVLAGGRVVHDRPTAELDPDTLTDLTLRGT